MNDRRLIVVSNRLPVSLERKEGRLTAQRTVGGLASALAAVGAYTPRLWIGWPGIAAETAEQQAETTTLLQATANCRPVFIPPRLFDRFYHDFSNSYLWPLFHYLPRLAHYESAGWEAYQAVNQLYSEQLLAVLEPGDRIWIHDYHLLLLPALIRQRRPDATIGFFLHIPFPSYELFRALPWREPLLRGLLGADLIGFHTYDYMRHFLRSLQRVLDLEHDFGKVLTDNRVIRVDTFPLGVDAPGLAEIVARQAKATQPRVPGQHRILSVDRMDISKGIPERLLAFERFLTQFRQWRGQVRLVLICVPSRTRVVAYQKLKRQIDELVGHINGKFSTPDWTPIQYLYRSFTPAELVAFYQAADVALVTPLRDGMNLVAKEYLACRADDTGVLVLSETAGAADELGEALVVNPNDLDGLARALQTALTMPVAEQIRRNRPMRERLRRYDVRRWADDFLSRLDEIKAQQRAQRRPRLDGQWLDRLRPHCQASQRRLLLLDYDGTLVPLAPLPDQALPDAEVRQLLQHLAADPANTVVVISGRDNITLERWLGGLGAVLVAEHGAWLLSTDGTGWRLTGGTDSRDWKEQIRPLLETFVDRTPGALIEEKALALAWHYRMANKELGSLRAKELADALGNLVANTGLQVLRGSKVIEVKHSHIGKGQAAMLWLEAEPPPDFILAAGDDETDEALFERLQPEAWSVRIGQTLHSHARFYLNRPADLRRILSELAELTPAPAPAGEQA